MAAKDRVSLDNSGKTPLHVPGYGAKLEHEEATRFAHGANDWVTEQRLTVRELAMLQVMDVLTDKPDWTVKVFDDQIVDKWRAEVLDVPDMSEVAFDWCIRELRDKATSYEQHKYATTLDTESRCAKSNELVGEEIRQELIAAVQPLLDGPKDWHPGSGEQVLDLVHPSLYPLVYGKTEILKTGQVDMLNPTVSCFTGEIIPRTERIEDMLQSARPRHGLNRESHLRWSDKFQWLPCEVKFKESEGTDVEITSYINNLHPNKFKDLYRVIEKVISLSIKPWNDVLVLRDHGRTPLRIKTFGAAFDPPSTPKWISTLPWAEEDAEGEGAYQKGLEEVAEYLELESNASEDSTDEGEWVEGFPDPEEDWAFELGLRGVAEWKYKRLRQLIHPEPGVAYSYEDWVQGKIDGAVVPGLYTNSGVLGPKHEYYDLNIQDEFREKGLQVIVKLAGIQLTPQKPKYQGGNWHIEGMLNEHIVATAIYYYDVDNVTGSRINFRQEAQMDDQNMDYPQNEHKPLCEIFGVDSLRDEAAVQEIGSVATTQGRLLAFPNTLQHCVEPFELEDKSKSGHRRFLVLWLVDPHYRIASTRNVPPQQYDWLEEITPQLDSVKQRLPPELTDMVFTEMSKDMMRLPQAKEYREELMRERSAGTSAIERNFHGYNFCEH